MTMLPPRLSMPSIAAPALLAPALFPESALELLPDEVRAADHFQLEAVPQASVRAWFTDMDGTLFDGKAKADPAAAAVLGHMASSLAAAGLPFAYLSGRKIGNIDRAIAEYGLPTPPLAAASVGSMIFVRHDDAWHEATAYSDRLREHWIDEPEKVLDALMARSSIQGWRHTSKTDLRRTYWADPVVTAPALRAQVDALLAEAGLTTIQAVVSGPGNEGFMHIDFVPDNGSKIDAAHFMARELLGLPDLTPVLFTGDSGNDRDLLMASGRAVLVKCIEEGLAAELLAERPDLIVSPHPHIYGVVDAMLRSGVLTAVEAR